MYIQKPAKPNKSKKAFHFSACGRSNFTKVCPRALPGMHQPGGSR
jgi:hypothetical protein